MSVFEGFWRNPRLAALSLAWAALAWATLLAAPGAHAAAKHAAMVMDANSGKILYSQAGDEPRFPASLTKMMTLYMAFELIDQGRLSYQTRIKMSQEAASQPPSKLDLDPGEEIALGDAIKALITKSANDVAVAIAEHIGGTEAGFARMMTTKAKKIGMTATIFRNASGLPDNEQVTTARDMLTLALRLQDDFPRHYGLFATRAFQYNGQRLANHNTLLSSYQGTDGIKTGYTRAAGFNLVASVRRDGKHLVAAVFGGSSAASRNAHMRSLLNRSFTNASTEKTRKPMLVAKATPAQRPKVVGARAEPVPEKPVVAPPRVAATAARPVPAAAPAAAVAAPAPASAVVEAPRAAVVADAPEPPAPAPAIEITKVRRVMVAPRTRPATAAAPQENSTEEPGSAHFDASPPRFAAAAATHALALRRDLPADAAPTPEPRGAASETVIGKSRPVAPTQAPSIMLPEAAIAPPVNRAPPKAPAVTPPRLTTTADARPTEPARAIAPAPGARPSTLATQAENLARGLPPVTSVSTLPQRTAVLPTAAPVGFQIQVGAYATEAEASRQLAAVSSRARTVLASASPVTLPVQKGERQMYRARFAGFDARSAANACLELRRLAVDCFVMRPD